MKTRFSPYLSIRFFALFLLLLTLSELTFSQHTDKDKRDEQVQTFLENHQGSWHDMNVPESDAKLLYDLIVENEYKNAVEIGTSTGYSTIWMAWAMSKTGGKVITIEIDRGRYNEALRNFKEAGLSEFIDARLADAHELVYELEGPVDFVFCDADKSWYTRYFKALEDKLVPGGCFAAHNTNMYGVREFMDYAKKLPGYRVEVDEKGAGMGLVWKKD